MYVAMKDLEIRGAGNLLGGEQSGHIEGVGFDLYVRMVGEAVQQFKGEAPEEAADVKIDLPVDAHLPLDYVGVERLRLEMYRKVAEARTPERLDEVEAELRDRYGNPPEPVRNLFAVARFRQVARARGLSDVSLQGRHIRFAPVPLPDSKQLRLKRYYPDAVYKAGSRPDLGQPSDDPRGRRRTAARSGAAGLVRGAPHHPARPGLTPVLVFELRNVPVWSRRQLPHPAPTSVTARTAAVTVGRSRRTSGGGWDATGVAAGTNDGTLRSSHPAHDRRRGTPVDGGRRFPCHHTDHGARGLAGAGRSAGQNRTRLRDWRARANAPQRTAMMSALTGADQYEIGGAATTTDCR